MLVHKVKELTNLSLRLRFLILKNLIDIQELLTHFFFIFFEMVKQDVGNMFIGFLQEQVAVQHSWVKLALFVIARSIMESKISFSVVLLAMATNRHA